MRSSCTEFRESGLAAPGSDNPEQSRESAAPAAKPYIRHGKCSERGIAFLEGAIVFPFLITLLIMGFGLGQCMLSAFSLSNELAQVLSDTSARVFVRETNEQGRVVTTIDRERLSLVVQGLAAKVDKGELSLFKYPVQGEIEVYVARLVPETGAFVGPVERLGSTVTFGSGSKSIPGDLASETSLDTAASALMTKSGAKESFLASPLGLRGENQANFNDKVLILTARAFLDLGPGLTGWVWQQLNGHRVQAATRAVLLRGEFQS